jgi:hypothetical protein
MEVAIAHVALILDVHTLKVEPSECHLLLLLFFPPPILLLLLSSFLIVGMLSIVKSSSYLISN